MGEPRIFAADDDAVRNVAALLRALGRQASPDGPPAIPPRRTSVGPASSTVGHRVARTRQAIARAPTRGRA